MSEKKKSNKLLIVFIMITAFCIIVAIVNLSTNNGKSGSENSTDAVTVSDVKERNSEPREYRPVSYESLSRDTNGMEGKLIKVKGEITQVVDSDTTYQGRIAITYNSGYYPYYSDNILFVIPKSIMNVRLLEQDIVTLCGESVGLLTYTSVLGSDITAPCIYVDEVIFENND